MLNTLKKSKFKCACNDTEKFNFNTPKAGYLGHSHLNEEHLN